MLKIRLMRPGKSVKQRTHYKIVVMEAAKARDSNFTAQLGYYNPTRKLLEVDLESYNSWIKKGAQPTETVRSLAKRFKKALEKAAASK